MKNEEFRSIDRPLLESHWDLLNKNSQIRLYIGNQNKEEITEIHNIEYIWLEDLNTNVNRKNENVFNPLSLFYKHIFEWESMSNTYGIAIQPYWIDHIFTRFYHTINHFPSKIQLNDYISNSILAFWNALIVEGFYANNNSYRILNDQNGDISEIFFKNYLSYLLRYKNEKTSSIMEQDLLLQWLLYCPLLHKYINPLISKFIIIARLHLKELRSINNVERRFIELLMYNASELTNTNILRDEYFFSRNNLIELYKKKTPMTPNKAENSNDKEKILDFLLEYYELRDNGEVYELLNIFNARGVKI